MRAMVIDRFGGPEILHLGDIEIPDPGPGEVLIRVAYAGVNPADWKCREGWLRHVFEYQFPFVLGFDAAGIIAGLGEGVTDYKIGDRVATSSNQGIGERGSYAEYLKVVTDRVAHLADSLDFQTAASIPTAAMTCREGLFDNADSKAGQSVQINGGAGGMGSFAIQFAKYAGARVAVTCGPKNIDYRMGLGADLAINYRAQNVLEAVRARVPDGVDLILDTVGQGSLPDDIAMMKSGGMIAPITTLVPDEPPFDTVEAARLNVRIVSTMAVHARIGRQLRTIIGLFNKGVFRAPEIKIMPLEETGSAHVMIKNGHVCGEIILYVADFLRRRQMRIAYSAMASMALLCSCAQQASAPTAEAGETASRCHTEMVLMRDGTKLATDIYMPLTIGSHPVVVVRNPYGWSLGSGCGTPMISNQLVPYVKNGYVAISQDVRGTNRSEGSFTPFFQEQYDGYDTIEWAAAQPWSNGKVSLVGGSYLGATQWQAAVMSPPHLVAISPRITATDYHDDWVYRNGVFDPLFNLSWVSAAFVGDQMVRKMRAQNASPADLEAETQAWKNRTTADSVRQWMSSLPLTGDWNPTLKEFVPFYFEWLHHPTYDAYWAAIDVGQHYSAIKVPAMIAGGWYDLFAVGSINSYMGMRDKAGTEKARKGTMLAMSWGGHAAFKPASPGQITWGPDPSDAALAQRFTDHYGKGVDNGIELQPRVQLVVLVPPDAGTQGSSFLYKTSDFPVPGTRWTKYYLRSGGRANGSAGDGRLDDARGGGAPDHFTYDPGNPVPTVGGSDGEPGFPAGAFDQSKIETRQDILVYKSAVLTGDLAVIGPISVSIWAKSSAHDTDFTAKLVDVHPDGFAHNVVDRIVRTRYRTGSQSEPEPIKPGHANRYDISLGATATIFRKGHRILLEISSSNFPHYARNLNTGLSNENTAEFVSAAQTILHDRSHPSFIELPIVSHVQN